MWLHVPNLPAPSSPSAAGSAGSSWECGWFGPVVALWVLSSGKPSPLPLSSLPSGEGTWISLLSGTISRPSAADRGAAEWISSLPASPVSPPASPGAGPVRVTIAGSGPSSGASPKRSAPASSSSRTSPASSPSTMGEPSARSSTRWPRAGGLRSGTAFPRAPSAPRTSVIVSSCSLPTPTASDYGSSQNGINGKGGANERPSAGTPSLSRSGALEQIRDLGRLPTPIARDHEGAGRSGQLPTELARLKARGALPTPTAQDARGSGVAGNWTAESGRHSGSTLTDVVARGIDLKASTPSSPPPPSTGTGTALPSPSFVEWMMGLAPGWSRT